MNKVILLGHLGGDAEMKYTQGGMAISVFRMATTDKRGTGEQRRENTQWHEVKIFGKLAENIQRFLVKGKSVMVEGRIEYREFEGRDGVKKYFTEIIASEVELLSGPQHGAARARAEPEPYDGPPDNHTPGAAASYAKDDTDLPF